MHHFFRVVSAGTGQDRHAAVGFVHEDLDDPHTRSAGVSVGFSPVVPIGTRKCTPASICRRPSRRTAASSRLPLLVNGVTSAVPHPVNGVLILDSQNVLHCEPAVAALDPLCRSERPARKRRAVAGRVRQHNRLGRAVEADGMRPRDVAGPGGRHIDRPIETCLFHRALQEQRRARRRILLRRVMRLVQERGELGLCGE